MSYAKRLGAVLLAAGLAAGCSGADGGGTDRTGGSTSGGGATTGGGAGTGDGTTTGGDFGNSGANPAVTNNTTDVLNPDAECKVGEKCDATSADEGCGSLTLEPDVEVITMPGNVLMIFDRSGSMLDDWNGMPRWQAAGSAMMTALMPHQDLLTIGAVLFPSDDTLLSCIVEPITAPTQIPFQPGPMALTKMQTGNVVGGPMYSPNLTGMTPTLEGLQQADAAFAGATLTGTTVAILVTDGDPNCAWNEATAISIVTAWAANGIKTYVLGVPGVGGAGEATLNRVAVAGGTMQYIAASDSTMLQQQIDNIVEQTVSAGIDSCEINLSPPAEAPDDLHIIVTENGMELDVPRDLSNGAGWTVTDDGSQVTLMGALCDNAKAGVYGSLRFEFGCVQLPPLPPIPPPQ